ncbi:MAG TPA: SGNH/GDSL hydrolase family protein, partial [Acidimicrobiales bacterium]|nr:SGNH/GDSL hydrolase family protein [Acidimicrobiales bacterium]
DLVENVLTWFGYRGEPFLHVRTEGWAVAVSTVARAKWGFAALTVLAVIGAFIAVMRHPDPSAVPHPHRVRRSILAVLATVIVGAEITGAVHGVVLAVGHGEVPNPPPKVGAAHLLVALGDSYTSGEGALSFFRGTNVAGINQCRRAQTAHPVRVARALDANLEFVACSGATVANINVLGQYPRSPPETPGRFPQIRALARNRADLVVLGIGGNDAGFGEIARRCATENCMPLADYWFDRLDFVYPRLLRVYSRVRRAARGAPVFVTTYPNPVGDRANCSDMRVDLPGLEIEIDGAERAFLRDRFIPRLNTWIRRAAREAGVNVVDLEDTLVGHRLCESRPEGRRGMNFLTLNRVFGSSNPADWGHNSLHPTPVGHRLMALRITDEIEQRLSLQVPPNPDPDPDVTRPVTEPLDVPSPYRFPPTSPCQGERLDHIVDRPTYQDELALEIDDALADSEICLRRRDQPWTTLTADGDGRATADLAFATGTETYDLIYRNREDRWVRYAIYAP